VTPDPGFKVTVLFQRRISPEWCILETKVTIGCYKETIGKLSNQMFLFWWLSDLWPGFHGFHWQTLKYHRSLTQPTAQLQIIHSLNLQHKCVMCFWMMRSNLRIAELLCFRTKCYKNGPSNSLKYWHLLTRKSKDNPVWFSKTWCCLPGSDCALFYVPANTVWVIWETVLFTRKLLKLII